MNNRLEIKSYIGVGPIVFGMTAEEVRSTLGCKYIEIARGLSSTPNADAFDSLGVFVYYNLKKKCKAIEMAGSAQPIYAGHDLLHDSVDNGFELLRSFDPAAILNNNGLTSYALGIGLYVPNCLREKLSRIEGVIAFRRGYYEKNED